MKKSNKKSDFFGLSSKDKIKIVKEANVSANKEQYELIKRQGGANALRQFCHGSK